MARFNRLAIDAVYDISDPVSGHWITEGIQGADAMQTQWPVGAEAWQEGPTDDDGFDLRDFDGDPDDIAE